jgi:hypothetical protein
MQSTKKKIIGIIVISVLGLSTAGVIAAVFLGSVEGTASITGTTSVDPLPEPEPTHDPLGPDPHDTKETGSADGESSILGWADYVQANAQYTCLVGKDYSPFDVAYKNMIVVGNLYGKVAGSSKYAWADAYYDGADSDCGWGVNLGSIDNDLGLEMYLDPAIVMDTSGSIQGHFREILELWECTGGCRSGCNGVATFNDRARTGNSANEYTFRKSVPVGESWCNDDYENDSLCVPRIRLNRDSTTGIRYYRYYLIMWSCSDAACSQIVSDGDEGCFLVNWIED